MSSDDYSLQFSEKMMEKCAPHGKRDLIDPSQLPPVDRRPVVRRMDKPQINRKRNDPRGHEQNLVGCAILLVAIIGFLVLATVAYGN